MTASPSNKFSISRKLCGVAALVALAGASLVRADTIVEQTNWYGTSQVQYYQPIGQSFTAVDTDLISAGLYIQPINSWSELGTLSMSIYAGEGSSGTLLGSQNFAPSAGFTGFYELNWEGLLAPLVVGNFYSVALSSNNYYWGVTSTAEGDNPYAGGRFFTNQGFENKDAAFRLVFAAAPVPETPQTIGLVLFAFAGLIAVRRRLSQA